MSFEPARCYDPQTKCSYVNHYDGRGWLPESKGYAVTHSQDYDRTDQLKRKYDQLKRELEPLRQWVNQRELDDWLETERRRNESLARTLRAQGRLW